MNITMNDSRVGSIPQLQELIKLSKQVEFQASSTDEVYAWITDVLKKFRYFSSRTRKKDRGIILSYITALTGLSRSHVKRLARRTENGKKRLVRITGTRNSFPTKYTASDIALLIETDNAHCRLSGKATKAILTREYAVYGKTEYETIKTASVSHLYNLRGTRQYASQALFTEKTKAVSVPIGERRKPQPQGVPGYLRVDTVHQGDRDREKGVYHVNLVDEVTQWEIVGCVEGISEQFLEPLLEALLAAFPFRVLGFHSDNGSEYINHTVARLLQKLLVEQTKSRSRRTNDNALVEGKNGAVIRKYMGYAYIPKKHARAVNAFYRAHMDEYLNFHRPCGFATEKVSAKGKIVKVYDTYQTPYEKLRSLPEWTRHLKGGITPESLDREAARQSDNECAAQMQEAKQKLFKTLAMR